MLTGTLPPDCGRAWSAMERLELQSNLLGGSLPAEWGEMARLADLRLL